MLGKLLIDCAKSLALTPSELLTIAATAPQRYYVWHVAKKSGSGLRTICQPARELKVLQTYFVDHVLKSLPVHSAATAYVKGSSIAKNARFHARSRVILKLDFLDFFPSLNVRNWERFAADHFDSWTKDDFQFSAHILFWGAKSYAPLCLAIGAPSSPFMSNVFLYEVDAALHKHATDLGLRYTRYADDMTFSSDSFLDKGLVLNFVKSTISSAKYSSLKLNDRKTVLVSKASKRRVTGLVITPDDKVSVGRDRKRLISSMVHRASRELLDQEDLFKLAGLIAFCLDAEPEFVVSLRRKYSNRLVDEVLGKVKG